MYQNFVLYIYSFFILVFDVISTETPHHFRLTQLHGIEFFLRSQQYPQTVKKFPSLIEPEGFCSQELDTIPFMDPAKSSLRTTSHGSFIISFHIFLPYTPRSSKQCSSFRLSQEASYGSVVCPTRSTCTHHPIHFDFFIINLYPKECKL